MVLAVQQNTVRGAVASWSARWTLDRALQVRASAGLITTIQIALLLNLFFML